MHFATFWVSLADRTMLMKLCLGNGNLTPSKWTLENSYSSFVWLCLCVCASVQRNKRLACFLDVSKLIELCFFNRTRSDWEKVWHQESHSRCRDKLVRHLYWACEKDIYRLARRSGMNSLTDGQKRSSMLCWWISGMGEGAHYNQKLINFFL